METIIQKEIVWDKNFGMFRTIDKEVEIDYPEEWAPVYFKGKDSGYTVSNYGNVRKPDGSPSPLYYDKDGYTRFCLYIPRNNPVYKNDKRIAYPFKTHRAVALAFIPNPDPERCTQVMHKNDINDCNFYTNLEWGTPKDNMDDKIKKGRLRVLHGSDKHDSIFNEFDVRDICILLEQGYTDTDIIISKLWNKTYYDDDLLPSYRNLINNVKRRHCWDMVTRNFKY